MRILLLTAKYGYGDASRGAGYEVENFIPAFERLGHEVEVFDQLDRTEFADFSAMNQALLRLVETWRPEIVFFVQHRYEIWTETLDIIRTSGISTVVYWATDDDWKYSQASRFFAAHVDVAVTTYPDKLELYRREGCPRVLLSQWAADARRLSMPVPAAECEYGVTFIGAAYGQRKRFAEGLTQAGLPVECFGFGWPNGPIKGDRITPILRSSVIALNFSGSGGPLERWTPNKRQIKARTFEVPGSGGFLLTEWAPGIDRYFNIGKEIDTFRSHEELVRKAKHYLEHPEQRDACAYAAHERVAEQHTYDKRLDEVIYFAESVPTRKEGGIIDWNAFSVAAAKHAATPGLQPFRKLLVSLLTKIFGARRGPRAARQLVFHLSRFVFGAKTYRSAGLPGRMFYSES